MATKKVTNSEPVKMTPTQMKKKIEALEETLRIFQEDTAWCYLCGKPKRKDKFYVSTDPMSTSGLTPICKDCAKKIALRVDKNGDEHEPTKESAQLALQYLNKPFLEELWTASIQESNNLIAGRTKSNAWTSYIKNVAMVNYVGLTYKDSDMFKEKVVYEDEKTIDDVIRGREELDTYADFTKNKQDVIRLLSYDPFEKESLADQPLLYSQLIGMLDASEDANDDMMRTSSAISIVRGFLQSSKIDDAISKYMSDISNISKNSGTIKALQDSKKQVSTIIKDLAAESCISLKNSKNAKKGENTWTGKIKKIKDMNLRDGQVNGFDIATCRGMQQVQEISDASIMKQLALDESEWSDMVAEMRVESQRIRKERDSYKEINRILLQENLDLKDYMEEKNIDISKNLANLKELYSVFASDEEEGSEDEQSDNTSE